MTASSPPATLPGLLLDPPTTRSPSDRKADSPSVPKAAASTGPSAGSPAGAAVLDTVAPGTDGRGEARGRTLGAATGTATGTGTGTGRRAPDAGAAFAARTLFPLPAGSLVPGPVTPRRPRTRTAGVGRVAARMRALAADLPPNDGVAVFNRVYLAVTDEVRHRMAAGEFPDGPRAARLTVVFAERYLAAVEGPPAAAPACWRALLRARGRRTAAPLQFALAGITAHVGHDLALAVVDACREAGCPPAGLDADFTEVGAVLAAVEERVREELMPGPDLLERFDAVTHAVGCWSLARARSGAWGAARVLWALRDHPRGFARCATGLDRTTALAVRALLAPAPRHPAPAASAADAAVAGPAEPAPVPSPARS